MEMLKDLNPQTVGIVGAVWLLREVFGFAKGFVKDVQDLRRSGADPIVQSELLESLKRVGDHISEQTELIRGFVFELKTLQGSVARVEKDVDDLRSEVRNRPACGQPGH